MKTFFSKLSIFSALLFIFGFWLQAGNPVFAVTWNCPEPIGSVTQDSATYYYSTTGGSSTSKLTSECTYGGTSGNSGSGKLCPTNYTYYGDGDTEPPASICPAGQILDKKPTTNACGHGNKLLKNGAQVGWFYNTRKNDPNNNAGWVGGDYFDNGYALDCGNTGSQPPSCGNTGWCYTCIQDKCEPEIFNGNKVYDLRKEQAAFATACTGLRAETPPDSPDYCKYCTPAKYVCNTTTRQCTVDITGAAASAYATEAECNQNCGCEYKCPDGYEKLPAGAVAASQAVVKCGAANLVKSTDVQPETTTVPGCTPPGATAGQCVKITCDNQPVCPDPNPNSCPAGQTLEQYNYTDPTTGETIPCNRCRTECACPTGTVWETNKLTYQPTNADCPTGQRLRTTNPWQRETGCAPGVTPKYCYKCETCTCPVGYRTTACPAGQMITDTQTVTCNPNLTCNKCGPIPGGGQCEPKIEVETRLYGYVVSDPKNESRLQAHNNGLQYCRMFSTQVVGNNGTIATEGTGNPLTQADFNVEITSGASGISNANDNPAKRVISAVGYYRFNNLKWNTDDYDLTLHINNKNQSNTNVSLENDTQHGVWICSCPKTDYITGGDPFTCSYKDIPVPSPSNDCVGGDDGMSSTGPYTIGDSEEPNSTANLERLIQNTNCYNPAPNFYVTVFDVTHGPWWQASGGMVYGNDGLESHIPTGSNIANTETTGQTSDYNKCVYPHCAPYLIAQTCNSVVNSTTLNTSSYPLIREGAINLSDNGGEVTPSNIDSKTARATGDTAASNIFYGPREDYTYFSGLIPDFNSLPGGGNVTGATSLDSMCPDGWRTIGDGRVCHVSSLQIANNANINVSSGKHTIFVTGDMNIGDVTANFGNTYTSTAKITVGNGAYLGFIVGGDINVAPHVGYANQNVTYSSGKLWVTGDSDFPKFGNESQTCKSGGYQEIGVVQGVYIASGRLAIQSNANPSKRVTGSDGKILGVGSRDCNNNSYLPDKKFVGEGTFVGWGGVDLYRTFDDNCTFTKAWHDRSPTEVFNYRPDLLQSAPEWMYRSLRLRLENV